ncbi:uncharacterized protein LOC117793712 [Drosophila innubila]|uniref:uncharacterized protein LOC117793712 n=1 Tax=Drosophila innubila TaxID=198719 RepID=UPI00148E56AA|nr:uncharacterized protein LOC117793712 [Drosophila innubila]
MNSVCIALLLLAGCIAARPQDLETGMLLAAAQLKELVETGAAARNDQSVEMFGQKMRGGMEMGFGDAMRPIGAGRRRRRRRRDVAQWDIRAGRRYKNHLFD